MQKGIKTPIEPYPTLSSSDSNDPTAEMQKGIKTNSHITIRRCGPHDPTAEMQKGIKTLLHHCDYFRDSHDPTAEMQKGIKTNTGWALMCPFLSMTRPQKCKRGLRQPPYLFLLQQWELYDPTAEMQKGIKTLTESYFKNWDFYDPTAEMQKGIKTLKYSLRVSS